MLVIYKQTDSTMIHTWLGLPVSGLAPRETWTALIWNNLCLGPSESRQVLISSVHKAGLGILKVEPHQRRAQTFVSIDQHGAKSHGEGGEAGIKSPPPRSVSLSFPLISLSMALWPPESGPCQRWFHWHLTNPMHGFWWVSFYSNLALRYI